MSQSGKKEFDPSKISEERLSEDLNTFKYLDTIILGLTNEKYECFYKSSKMYNKLNKDGFSTEEQKMLTNNYLLGFYLQKEILEKIFPDNKQVDKFSKKITALVKKNCNEEDNIKTLNNITTLVENIENQDNPDYIYFIDKMTDVYLKLIKTWKDRPLRKDDRLKNNSLVYSLRLHLSVLEKNLGKIREITYFKTEVDKFDTHLCEGDFFTRPYRPVIYRPGLKRRSEFN